MTDSGGSVRSLARGLAILRALAARGSASLAELHRDTQISRPAILRLLQTLEDEGYARRWLSDGRYRISSAAPEIIRTTHLSAVIADIVGPALRELLNHLSWPADVAIASGTRMMLCETTRRQSPHLINPVGAGYTVHMLQSAVGRVYLAFCSAATRDRLLNALRASEDPLDHMARDTETVEALLADVRQKGYALRAAGYNAIPHDMPLAFTGVALPLLSDGRAVACISITWVATAMTPAGFIANHMDALRDAARQAEAAIASSGIAAGEVLKEPDE